MTNFSTIVGRLDRLVDWFIPASIAADKEKRKRARLFLISHLLGPFIGNSVPLAMLVFDPTPGYEMIVLAASITGFWIFPPLLKLTARYETLALISIVNLCFCILWSCYFYGGVTSPTLPWVLTIPLLAFFYVDNSLRMRAWVLTILASATAIFAHLYSAYPPANHDIPLEALQGLGLVSTVGAALYVAMMATYYANALSTQMELEAVARKHLIAAAELRQAAAMAERASIAKAEFLAKMSHELRTPLNAVIGYSQMLMEDAEIDGDNDNIPDLEKIHAAGHHLLGLVNAVLDLSKIEAGQMELFVEEFHMPVLLSSLAEDLKAAAARHNNQIHLMMSEDLGSILGDMVKIRSAISHVLNNANKYTRDGHITITSRRVIHENRPFISVAIRDTGIGIAEEHLPSLFEQFAVADDQTSTKYGGTGVGLALTRKLCQLMHGNVEVETALNKGSCFTLLFPVSQDDWDKNFVAQPFEVVASNAVAASRQPLEPATIEMIPERKVSNA